MRHRAKWNTHDDQKKKESNMHFKSVCFNAQKTEGNEQYQQIMITNLSPKGKQKNKAINIKC